MNLYYFISKRIHKSDKNSFSSIVSKIAVLSISVGIVVMITSFAILEGFSNKIQDKIFSFGSHIQVTMHDKTRSYSESPLTVNSALYKYPDSISEISHIQVYSHNLGLLKKKDSEEFTGAILKGVGKDFDRKKFSQNIIKGNFIEFKEDTFDLIEDVKVMKRRWSEEVLVSKKIANKLNLNIGDRIYMFFMKKDVLTRPLTVKGIYETGLEEFDELIIIGDIKLNQVLNQWDTSEVGGYEIFVKDFSKLDEAYEKVYDAMDSEMQIEKISDKYIQIFDWLALINKNVVIFLFIILFVACFNIISTIFIMIMERINMIGLLKALGATNKQVQSIFFYNGISIILKGLFYGNLLALGFCFVQYYFKLIPLDPVNYYMNTVPIEWNWPVILALNLLVFVLIAIVVTIPILVISNIKPIKSIKFD